LKCEEIWTIWKKVKLNSEKILKIWKKSRLNSEKILKNMEEKNVYPPSPPPPPPPPPPLAAAAAIYPRAAAAAIYPRAAAAAAIALIFHPKHLTNENKTKHFMKISHINVNIYDKAATMQPNSEKS